MEPAMTMDAAVNFALYCLPRPTVTSAATFAVAEGEGHHGKDHISALPDDLLHDVVSRLPIRDTVRTTTLSTRWRDIWRYVPLVLFDQHISASTQPEHVAAINSVLASHMGPLRAVHLALCDFNNHEPELAEWPEILAGRGVQDLVFINLPMTLDRPLPASILRYDKLCRLYLGFWKFPDTTNLPAADFPQLQELAILGVLMEDRDLDHMLASSPALEKLALVMSYLPKHVRLLSQNLKCVIIYCSTAVEVVVAAAPCLERLIMWKMCPYTKIDESEDSHVGVRIVEVEGAPALKVLGYLDTRVHQLRFGDNTVIKVQADTDMKASPICRVPRVKILAMKVNLNVFAEVQMLPSFLRCFPSIEVLHIESAVSDESSGDHNPEFFEKLISPIECVQLHIKEVFLYQFQGHQSEMTLLKYLALRANQMQKLTLVLPYEELDSEGENDFKVLHGDLLNPEWASEDCTILVLRPSAKVLCCFHTEFDLSIEDPFLLNDGKELFSVIKKREQDAN